MRRIREVLRLKAEARLSDRQIAAVIGSARSTVQECLRRARAAGIGWPLPTELDDDELIARLYPRMPTAPRYPTPDFPTIQAELAHKGVTRMLLWQEYKAKHPDGWSLFLSNRPDQCQCRTHKRPESERVSAKLSNGFRPALTMGFENTSGIRVYAEFES